MTRLIYFGKLRTNTYKRFDAMDNVKFLDKTGLAYFMSKLKTELAGKVTLGEDGKIIASQLPNTIDDVVEFSGIVTGEIEIKPIGIVTATQGYVVYCTEAKTFAYAIRKDFSLETTYYAVWPTRDSYVDDINGTPYSGKIYVDTSTNMLYRWDGNTLVEAGAKAINTVDISVLDTVPSSIEDAVTKAEDALHSRWALTSDGANIGVIDMFSNGMKHQLTQVLTTHYTMNDGVLDFTGHDDTAIYHYYRSYNICATDLGSGTGAWTAWQEDLPKALVSAISVVSEKTDSATKDIDTLNSDIAAVKEDLEKKASLGSNGKVLPSQLPSYVDEVVDFDSTVEDTLNILQASTTDTTGFVVYSTVSKTFAYGVRQSALSSEITYYSNWSTRARYTDGSFVPLTGRIFVDKSTSKSYRWSGSILVEIGQSLGLGYDEESAYPGNEGAALQSDYAAFKASKGQAHGLAPLDEDGLVREDYLPVRKQVVAFDGTVSGVTVLQGSTATPTGVVYEKTLKKFVAYVQESAMSMKRTYYANWAERKDYQDVDTDVPHTERLYVDTAGQAVYAWDGAELKRMSGSRHVTLTQTEYDALVAAGSIDAETYYNVVEDEE